MKNKIIISLIFILFLTLTMSINIEATEPDVYSYDFSSVEKVNENFRAFYKYDMGTDSREIFIGENEEDNTHLYLKDNKLIRKNFEESINLSLDTRSFTILTLTKEKFVNFELTVDYKMGNLSYYWPVVAFRQAEIGKYFLETGMGAFVQQQGRATFWGTDGVGGPYESDIVQGYSENANDWHTMKLIVDGTIVKMFLDGSSKPVLEKSVSSSVFRSGYISLISVNNNSEFRNLKIKKLPVNSLNNKVEQPPVNDANTYNSLNNLTMNVEKIDELKGIDMNNDFDNIEQTKPWFVGILGVAILGSIALISIAINVFLLYKRRF